jgi:hypothetical protein
MKTFAHLRPWLTHGFVPLLLAGLLAGCATQKVDWAGRVGNYTLDQAIIDLGPPDKQAGLQDGSTVAEWLTQRGYLHGRAPIGYGYPCYYGPYYSPYTDFYRSPDYYLRLIFAPDNRLQDWKTFYR